MHGMRKLQLHGVQKEPGAERCNRRGCVQGIAQHGVANMHHVHPELV